MLPRYFRHADIDAMLTLFLPLSPLYFAAIILLRCAPCRCHDATLSRCLFCHCAMRGALLWLIMPPVRDYSHALSGALRAALRMRCAYKAVR